MAPQNSLAPLEELPTEILQMILSEMASTSDLSSTIHASPELFRAFLGFREQILIRVIESSLERSAFNGVLALLHIPHFSDLPHGPIYYALARFHIEDADFWEVDTNELWRYYLKFDAAEYWRDIIHPFPTPKLTQPVDEDQVVEFRRKVNSVVEIFGDFKRHMEVIYEGNDCALAQYRYLWVPGTPHPDEIDLKSWVTELTQWHLSLDEQRKYFREAARQKKRITN